jgi:hypothetical protein
VRLNGLDADLEAVGNFLILEAGPNEMQDLLFTARQGLRAFPERRGSQTAGVIVVALYSAGK